MTETDMSLETAEAIYGHVAADYLAAGLSPLPLGRPGELATKAPVPKGFTGRDRKAPDMANVTAWAAAYTHNNVGVVCPAGYLMIDVDEYDKPRGNGHVDHKHGAAWIAEQEKTLGPLPPTLRTTSRGAASPSGIRVYRLPEGFVDQEFDSAPGDAVETVQPHHRYAVVWPSIHPEGRRYEWITANGDVLHGVPDLASAATLPVAWAAALEVTGGEKFIKDRSVTELSARAWVSTRGERLCETMQRRLDISREHLEAAAEGARHDTARRDIISLAYTSRDGHPGLHTALVALRKDFIAAVEGENRDAGSEWTRLVVGAVAIALGPAGQEPAEVHDGDCLETLIANPTIPWGQPIEQRATAEVEASAPIDQKGYPTTEDGTPIWPAPTAPLKIAERMIDTLYRDRGKSTIGFWGDDLWLWDGAAWGRSDVAHLEQATYQVLEGTKYVTGSAPPQLVDWNPTKQRVTNITHALLRHGDVLAEGDPASTFNASGRIPFANGCLDLKTGELAEHSPSDYNTWRLPYAYDAEAGEPVEWFKFLASLQVSDEVLLLLQQWFGYVISGRTEQQKFLILVGSLRAGKGVITRTLSKLVGRENCASPTLDQFATNFGMQSLIGKKLISINDARFSGRSPKQVIERLLNVTGGDAITIDRKNKEPWTGVLPGRVMLVSNELPHLSGESSPAFPSRAIGPIELTRTFYGHEDVHLEERLAKELPAIALWGLAGLRSLDEAGKFIEPKESAYVRHSLQRVTMPLTDFIEETCDLGVDYVIPNSADLYDEYTAWCSSTGRRAASRGRLEMSLRSHTNGAVSETFDEATGVRGLAGIRIKTRLVRSHKVEVSL